MNQNEPLPVFDGLKWPEEEVEQIPTIEIGTGDVIDVWTQKQSEEQQIAQETVIRYHDIPNNTLKKLISAIKYPTEVRLLPHIIREWHRQTFPISIVDAQRIARLATRHDEIDVVLQMNRPEVYGLYYDMQGIREITRGLAKRAATVNQSEEKRLTPDEMLHSVPALVNFAVGSDANRLLKDPAVLGTQLWGFIARFNRDPSFRNQRNTLEICGLAERVVDSIRDYDFNSLFSSQDSSSADGRQIAFNMKYQSADFYPVLYALRQFIEIVLSPYRHCHVALEQLENTGESFPGMKQLKQGIAEVLNSRLSTTEAKVHSETETAGVERSSETPQLRWVRLNQRLGTAIREGDFKPKKMEDWQWALLKRHTAAAAEAGKAMPAIVSLPPSFFLPIISQGAVKKLEDALRSWRRTLKMEKIPVKSEFKMDIVQY